MIDSPVQKDQLESAQMAQFHYWATSDEAKKLRELVKEQAPRTVAPEKRSRSAKPDEVRAADESLDALLAELIRASGRSEAGGYFYRSSSKQGFTDDPDCKMTARNFEGLIGRLEEHLFLERVMGFQRHGDFDGPYIERRRAGRYRATPKLLSLSADLGITPETMRAHYQKPYRPTVQNDAMVTVRHSETKDELKLTRTPRLDQLEDEVRRINDGLAKFTFNLETHPFLRRRFSRGNLANFDYNHEGRLYAEFQQMPAVERSQICIDGEASVEIDIKSSQLTILYALSKQPLPEGDLYYVEGIHREVVKAAVTTMIGNGHTKITRWSPAILEKFRNGKLLGYPVDDATRRRRFDLKEIVPKIVKAIPVLHSLSPIKRDWGVLQNTESNVIVATMLELIERGGFPVLPVHDSLIVPQSIEGPAAACLKANFLRLDV